MKLIYWFFCKIKNPICHSPGDYDPADPRYMSCRSCKKQSEAH